MILFPVAPSQFLQQMKNLIEEVVDAKITKEPKMSADLAEKTLLLPKEVCTVLRISASKLYSMDKAGILRGFKIQSRRYYARTDVEKIIGRLY
jgi:hypothetical protein